MKGTFDKATAVRYGKNTVMGIQHLFAMMGATILVPILCNLSISVALISAGTGTLIFFFITKKKVPVFLGSSFAFIGALVGNVSTEQVGSAVWNAAMGKVSIAIFFTGLVYFLFSLLAKTIGSDKLRKLFPPVVVGPVIIVIGMSLAPVVFSGNIAGSIDSIAAFTGKSTAYASAAAWTTSIITAAVIVGVAMYAKGFFKVIPVLFGILAGYVVALIFGIVDFGSVKNAHWLIFQPEAFKESFGFYKNLSFDISVILAFAPVAIVTFMEHLGDINASSIIVGKDFFKDPGVHRTLLGDGAATAFAGLLGGPPNTTYGENTAVLAITKNYNPNLLALAAIFAIFLGVFSKFGGLLGTVPGPVIGGASMILFGMIAANGLKTMVEAKLDFSDTKNMLIVSIILVVGIGMSAAGLSVNIFKVSFSPLAVVTVIGIVLNLLLPSQKVTVLSATHSDTSDGTDAQTKE